LPSEPALRVKALESLGAKGILSDAEVREVYEQALLLLEQHQVKEPEMRPIYEAAREMIEAQLQ